MKIDKDIQTTLAKKNTEKLEKVTKDLNSKKLKKYKVTKTILLSVVVSLVFLIFYMVYEREIADQLAAATLMILTGIICLFLYISVIKKEVFEALLRLQNEIKNEIKK